MENLLLSFHVVMPLCLIMALGYGIRQLGWIDDKSVRTINNLAFRVFIPILIFYNVYNTRLDGDFQWEVFVFAVVGVLALFGILFLIIPRIEPENAKRGVLIQGIGRSNFVLFGLSVAEALYGAGNSGVTALLVAVVVPMFNVLSVVALEVYGTDATHPKKIIKGILTNPLIIASILGILVMAVRLKLPSFVETTVSDLSKIATPLALFVLGASFSFSKVGGNLRQLLIGVTGKLVINPLIFLTAGVLCGFRDIELASLMVIFAAPTAVNSFTMAQQMGGDADLAGQLVVFTSVFAVITMFMWIFVTKQMGWI